MQKNRLDNLLSMLHAQPDDAFLLYGIAIEYQSASDFEKAGSYFEKLLAIHPDYLAAYYQAGLHYISIQKYEMALLIFEKGMEIAQLQKNNKTFNELLEVKENLEDEIS